MKVFISVLLVLGLASCYDYPDDDFNVYVENHIDSDIMVCSGYFSPDTTFERYLFKETIEPNKKVIVLPYNTVYTLRPETRKDTLSVFILSSDTVLHYNWHIISSNYNILIRYDLSGLDIQKLNSVIPYPPTPSMQNMKMYPSYEEIINSDIFEL